jgi:hypothetical protein
MTRDMNNGALHASPTRVVGVDPRLPTAPTAERRTGPPVRLGPRAHWDFETPAESQTYAEPGRIQRHRARPHQTGNREFAGLLSAESLRHDSLKIVVSPVRGSRATAAELDLDSAVALLPCCRRRSDVRANRALSDAWLLVRSESPSGAAGDACLRPTAGAVSVPLEDRRPGRRLEPRGGSVRTSACLPIGAMELWRVRADSSTPSSRS